MKRLLHKQSGNNPVCRNRTIPVFLLALLFFAQANAQTTSVPYTTPGTYTFTAPSGVTSVTVECWGGGGAGGGATYRYYGGAGGAGGAYATKVVSVTPGNSYTVTVGSGGNGGTGDGPSGGSSWFKNTNTVLAKGGQGGQANGGSAGSGTTSGSIGTPIYKGGDGIDNYYYYGAGGGGAGSTGDGGSVSTYYSWIGGTGTTTGGGDGGDGSYYSSNGGNGHAAGGGGGGAYTTSNYTDYSGGNGGDGQVIVTYALITPSITSFTPSSGCANSTSVVITGTNFTSVTAVKFGGTNAASYTVNSSTQITAIPASGSTGVIKVVTPQGNATSSGTFTINTALSVSASATQSCVGGSSGTITINASGGGGGYTYSLNGGSYQAANTFSGLSAATYTLDVLSGGGCSASTTATVSDYSTSTDNQNTAGTNTWIGHAYDGTNFSRYIGYFSEPETFDESFGGNATCFSLTSSLGTSSIYTETFSVAFKMNSTRNGLYIADLGSDDGSRLTVDGTCRY